MPDITSKTTAEMSRADLEEVVKRTPVPSAPQSEVDTKPKDSHPLLSRDAFEQMNQKLPFAKRPSLKFLTVGGGGLFLALLIGFAFRGNVVVEQPAVESESTDNVEPFSEEADRIAAIEAENANLKRQLGLSAQSLSQAELDALAEEPETEETSAIQAATPPTTPPTTTASTPAPVRTAPINSVSYRAPTPAPVRTPVSQPVRTPPAPIATVRPQPIASQPVAPRFVPEPPVDPYEMRDRLARLGSYGQPVAMAVEPTSEPRLNQAPSIVVTPTPQMRTESVDYRPSMRADSEEAEFVESEEYYEDVAVALGLPLAEVSGEVESKATAILPGEVFGAELLNGVRWRDGDSPEIALQTTEDLAVENDVLIPAGTRMLATLLKIDEAGGLRFDISQIFVGEETDEGLVIPLGSLVIQAEDGSALRASRADGSRDRSNLNRTVLGSALNVLDNVIESDGSLVGDVAGGVGEAVLEDQRDRVDEAARRQAAISNSRASVWELTPRKVQIFVSRYIPLGDSNEN